MTDALWPDFDEAELERAIAAYQKRDRRFGGVKDMSSAAVKSAGG